MVVVVDLASLEEKRERMRKNKSVDFFDFGLLGFNFIVVYGKRDDEE